MVNYDYINQAWIRDGKYQRCGHRGNCRICYGTRHEGELAPKDFDDMPDDVEQYRNQRAEEMP